MSNVIHDLPTDSGPDTPVDNLARQQAIRQIERKRRFQVSTILSAIGMAILVVIWATAEYHSAGGWPVHGFSQSSGIHEVWNFWIVYPLGAWLLIVAVHAWLVYGNQLISESEIEREMDRQAGPRRLWGRSAWGQDCRDGGRTSAPGAGAAFCRRRSPGGPRLSQLARAAGDPRARRRGHDGGDRHPVRSLRHTARPARR